MNDLRLADLVDIASLRKMTEAHFASTGMPIGIIDAIDSGVLVGTGWQEICLQFHRAVPESLQRCQESDSHIAKRLKAGQESKYKCKNGLWDIGVPIIVAGQHLATLFLGQFFYEDEVPQRDFFIEQARKYGYDQGKYLQALAKVPMFSRQTVENIIKYNKAFAEFITRLAEESLAVSMANQTIREARERLSILFEKAADAIYVASLDGKFIHVNGEACRATGYSSAELLQLGVTDIDALTRDDDELQVFFNGLSADQPATVESLHRRKDGSTYPVEIRISSLKTKDGPRIIGIARDISERRAHEAEQQRNEMRYKQAQRMGKVGNWEFDPVSEAFWASEEAQRIFGFDPGTQKHTTEEVENCIPERERVHQALVDLLERNIPYDIEYEIRPADGSKPRIIKSVAQQLNDGSGSSPTVIGVIQDVTERKKMESRLQHAQKMEAVGNLAGGIAHDFNNILSPIIGYAELLLAQLPSSNPSTESIKRILNAGRRGSELVKQILAFSRQSDHRMLPIEMQQIVHEVITLGRSTIPTNIEMVHNIQEDCRLIVADPTQIHQIGMNLITNAYQAIGENEGRISIELKEAYLEPPHGGEGTLEAGSYALLSVADTGCGIDPEVQANIFEPYFTTKELGKGTGLGLSVVYGIVKELRGDIKVYSEPEKGTCITVMLPVLEESGSLQGASSLDEYPPGTEHILVVDDEEPIVELVSMILRRLGYKVTGTVSSREAMEMFHNDPEAFDLILTDMTMPYLTGDQLIKKIHETRPSIPAIVCTGFSEKIRTRDAFSIGASALLMKPVSSSELATAIRKALD